MKRLLISLIVCLGLASTGCIDVNIKMKLGKDDSADMSLKLEMLDQMFQMLQVSGQQMGVDMTLLDEKALRDMVKQDGGTLTTFTNKAEEGIRKVNINASFPDAKSFLTKTAQGMISISQEGDVYSWNFLDSDMTAAYETLDDEVLTQQLALLGPQLTGLKFAIEVEVPNLVETNLNKVGANTCKIGLDYDRDIAGKEGKEAINAFRDLLKPKWVKYKK